MNNEDLITQEVVIDAVNNPSELGDKILTFAVEQFQKLSPEAQEIYLDTLREKAANQ